jgi:hypothetical protein
MILLIIITLGPGLEILCMNVVRTVGGVHILIVPSIMGFHTGKNLTAQAASILWCCRLMVVTSGQHCQTMLKLDILDCSCIIGHYMKTINTNLVW